VVDAHKPHWPSLDGLRALSVVAVILYHAELPLAASGYAGVDVFFVLSGFLITRLLLDEQARRGRIDLRAFYVRRALRLLPALVAVCAFVLLIAVVAQRQVGVVAKGVVASLLYVANVWIYSGHDTVFLQHAWTLALEEQFYLLWPPLVVLMLGGSRRRAAGIAIGVLAALTLLIIAPLGDVAAGVQHNYLRATGLVIGCLLGWVTAHRTVRVPTALAAACLAGIALLLLGPWPVPEEILTSGYSVVVLLSVPVLLALTDQHENFKVMDAAPVVWVGRRSYGLYLWHFPILSLVVHQAPASVPVAVRTVVALSAAVVVAALSYRVIEQPFLARKRRFQRL
jgi:peptidoglycan/LPS O-acetylase OafA/YrhL